MATEVTLPDLGDGIESGEILEIFVSVGDTIRVGQDIVEIGTDKATAPISSKHAGKVLSIAVGEGDTVKVGGLLLTVEAAAGAETKAAPAAKPPEPAPVQPPVAPPAPPQPVRAAAPVQAPQPTVVPNPVVPNPVVANPVAVAPIAIDNSMDPDQIIPAGPAVRRFAREVGVNLATVAGSGESGRITRDDVLSVVRATSAGRNVAAAPTPAAPAGVPISAARQIATGLPGTTAADDYGPTRVERISPIRKTIARQMNLSSSTVPRVTNFDDADISDLEMLRQSSKDDYAAQGLKLTTMPFLIKAVATALRHHSTLNAVYDEANNQIIYKDYVNIGIAVDTDNGLVVPVMKNADTMGIPEITRALAALAGKVRGGQFGVSDMRGGSFTISNLGAIGGQYSTPIVNVPEVAILLVGRSRKLPVVMPDDSIKPRLMMPLSLSYDHRLVDGAAAGRFLNDVIGYLQAPSRLLLAL
jgi:pyruvate dehydrogenase E2 component (dihydrolipoamide acetyltransferase)